MLRKAGGQMPNCKCYSYTGMFCPCGRDYTVPVLSMKLRNIARTSERYHAEFDCKLDAWMMTRVLQSRVKSALSLNGGNDRSKGQSKRTICSPDENWPRRVLA